MYYPIFSFTDAEGNVHKIRSSYGENPPSYRAGDTIAVYYDPDNPSKNKFDRFFTLWLGPAILGVTGFILVSLGGLVSLLGPVIVHSVYGAKENRTILQPTTSYEETSFSATIPLNALGMPDEGVRMWAMLSHMTALCVLAGIPFGNILAPLFIWLWKRRSSPLVDRNAKESLNFQISLTLYAMVSFVLCFVLIGFVLLLVLIISDVVLVILASLKAEKGSIFRYPFTLRFLR
jgi:uncharacterized Tic20 family protein